MPQKAIRAHLIAGGQYHDIDFARLSLLGLLSQYPEIRTTSASDYSSLHHLDRADFLVSYTCNVVPDAKAVHQLHCFLERGGRWLALHGTNSILAQNEAGRWYAREDKTGFVELLGSQFAAHPPIAPYRVDCTKPEDPLVSGIESFEVEGGDELYYMRMFGDVEVILDAAAQGPAKGFIEREWDENGRHPVLYRKRVGNGEIVYFTLGHRRGHYDMEPLLDYYQHIEKGAWEITPYQEILSRCVLWAKGEV